MDIFEAIECIMNPTDEKAIKLSNYHAGIHSYLDLSKISQKTAAQVAVNLTDKKFYRRFCQYIVDEKQKKIKQFPWQHILDMDPRFSSIKPFNSGTAINNLINIAYKKRHPFNKTIICTLFNEVQRAQGFEPVSLSEEGEKRLVDMIDNAYGYMSHHSYRHCLTFMIPNECSDEHADFMAKKFGMTFGRFDDEILNGHHISRLKAIVRNTFEEATKEVQASTPHFPSSPTFPDVDKLALRFPNREFIQYYFEQHEVWQVHNS